MNMPCAESKLREWCATASAFSARVFCRYLPVIVGAEMEWVQNKENAKGIGACGDLSFDKFCLNFG